MSKTQDKAISEHLSGQLLITGACDLWALMDAMRYLAREPTEERLLQGFKLLCENCMPKMDISDATRQSVIAYLHKFWLAPKWREAWVDFGRTKHEVPFFMSVLHPTRSIACCSPRQLQR